MTTIRDVARLAGYSPATVSRVMNGSGYASPAARAKIEAVMANLDYVPNDIARDLSHGHTLNVGVVMPNMGHPYFTQVINGILRSAFAADYNVVMLQSKYNADLELTYLEQLHRKAFDALIFTSHELPLTKLMAYQKYGAVVCCEDPGDVAIAAAFSQREPAYLRAFHWIKNQGYRDIAVMLSRPDGVSATSHLTLQTYQSVFGHPPVPELVVTGVTTYEDGYQAAATLATRHRQPDFLFSNGDDIVAGMRQYYLDQRLAVPPLMGQENQLSGQLLNITTIDHHLQRVGQAAFNLAASGEIKQLSVAADLILRR